MENIFATFPILIGFIITASEYIDRIWDLEGWQSWVRTAVIGLIASLVGSYFQLGFFADCTLFEFWCSLSWIWQGLLAGAICIGAANGLFAFEKVKDLLILIRARK